MNKSVRSSLIRSLIAMLRVSFAVLQVSGKRFLSLGNMKPQNKSANKNTLRISLSYSALSKWALETLPALVVSKTKGSLLRHSKCRRTTCWRKGAVAAVCNAVEREEGCTVRFCQLVLPCLVMDRGICLARVWSKPKLRRQCCSI